MIKVNDISKFYDDTIDTVEYDNFNQYREWQDLPNTTGIELGDECQ